MATPKLFPRVVRILAAVIVPVAVFCPQTLRAANAPVVTTGPADGLTADQATLHATVNPRGAATVAYFQYRASTSPAFDQATPTQNIGSGNANVAVAAILSGLLANTDYFYRVAATNSKGATFGAEASFHTAVSPPVAVTLPATGVSYDRATLNGTVNPNDAPATAYFEWGATTNYGNATAVQSFPAGTNAVAVTTVLFGAVAAGTTYHFRLVTANSSGTTLGADLSFNSLLVPPAALTGVVSDLGGRTATLHGTVDPKSAPSSAYFEWGPSLSYGNMTPAQAINAGPFTVAVAATLSGLTPGGVYHFRLVATNAAGASFGQDRSFATVFQLLNFSADFYSTYESNRSLSLTVKRTPTTEGQAGARIVLVPVSAGTDDFATNDIIVNFAAGESSKTVTVELFDDDLAEGVEEFQAFLQDPTGNASIGPTARTSGFIHDDDSPGRLRLDALLRSVPESIGAAGFMVTRLDSARGVITVDFTTIDSTATAGLDFVPTNGTLIFADGETTKTIYVTILEDVESEPTERLLVQLYNPTEGATFSFFPQAVVEIEDNDPVGLLQFSALEYSVVETDTVATITVSRSGGVAAGRVDFATSDQTALAGLDYQGTNGTLNFAYGETTRTFQVRVIDDAIVEGPETLGLTLSNPSVGATLGASNIATVTILDDERPPAVCTSSGLAEAVGAGGVHRLECNAFIRPGQTLVVSNEVTLDASSGDVTISGTKLRPVFEVRPGATLTLIHLTITEGLGTNGGGIYNQGSVRLVNCRLSNNCAVNGAAVYNDGLLQMWDSTFSGNQSQGTAGTNGLAGQGGNGTNGIPGTPGSKGGSGAPAKGGAICNAGSCRATNCVLTGNRARGGAGGQGGAGGPGGTAIDFRGRCVSYTLPGSGADSGGGAEALGGAFYNSGVAVMERVNFHDNVAEGGAGGAGGPGGILLCGSSGTYSNGLSADGGEARGGACFNAGFLTLSQSLFESNEARGGAGGDAATQAFLGFSFGFSSDGRHGGDARGGALCNMLSNSLVNVTVASNRVVGGTGGRGGRLGQLCSGKQGNGGNGLAGGLFNAGQLNADHCTIWDNLAAGGSVTGFVCQATSPNVQGTNGMAFGRALVATTATEVRGTIIGGVSSNGTQCLGSVIDRGHNICSDASAGFTLSSSLNSTDPKLAPLAENGGATRTFALLRGSPALDSDNDAECPAIDQRGVLRPQGAHCDIGAFEATWLAIQADGPAVVIEYDGIPQQSYVLEVTTDFAAWARLQTNEAAANGHIRFSPVPAGPPTTTRFFRTASP